ncbi:MAG: hypothetical protein CMJ58_27475 [Planctomycetaceae bacterium]|nr:hypothetical protein [Planctomycetaceae bacterium]
MVDARVSDGGGGTFERIASGDLPCRAIDAPGDGAAAATEREQDQPPAPPTRPTAAMDGGTGDTDVPTRAITPSSYACLVGASTSIPATDNGWPHAAGWQTGRAPCTDCA